MASSAMRSPQSLFHSPVDAASASSDYLSVAGSALLEVFRRVADQRDTVRRDLSFAMETIEELKTHISGLNYLLMDAQRHLEAQKPNSFKQELVGEVSDEIWIEQTWLRSPPSLNFLLGDAEKEWERGNPQMTNKLMFQCLDSDTLDFEGRMMCRLLIAAVLHTTGDTDRSMQFADDVLKNCGSQYESNPVDAREVASIAQFLRGKNFLHKGNQVQAYWAFARATASPRYKAKAQQLKDIAAKHMPKEGYTIDIRPIRPLFNHRAKSYLSDPGFSSVHL